MFNTSSNTHRARTCGFIRQPIRFNIPVPGSHAGRSRAHVELVRCTNPYQIKPCGTHARADVEILPDPLFSQRPQHKNIQTNGLSTEIFTDVSRALLRIMGKPILRTPAATPASGVHLMGRAWPLGVTKMSACVVSPAPGRNNGRLFSAPPWARWSGGRNNI